MKCEDLSGRRFHRLTVIRLTGDKVSNSYLWECLCDCGNICKIASRHLKSGNTKSCGCLQRERVKVANRGRGEDLTGQRFGRLIVKRKTENKCHKDYKWECVCDCGSICEIPARSLRTGATKSCGCLLHEARVERGKALPRTTKDLYGKRFGRLVAIEKTERRRGESIVWKCQCDCGNIHYADASTLALGGVKSCGCLKKEMDKDFGNLLTRIDGTVIEVIESKRIYANNKTGVRGVWFDRNRNLYRAYITFKRKRYELGLFSDLESAAAARHTAEEKIFGEFLEWYYGAHPDVKKERIKRG